MNIARAGVAIVMAPHIRLMAIEHIMEGKMTMVRGKVNWVKLVIYSCYCPTEEHSTSSKETFYRTLHRAIQKTRKEHPSYKIIAAGYFNTTIGQDCNHESWREVGPYHDEDPTSFNGIKLLETAECNKLYILNSRDLQIRLRLRVRLLSARGLGLSCRRHCCCRRQLAIKIFQ